MAFSAHDVVPDSPTNTFATLNALSTPTSLSLSDGNLFASFSGGNVFRTNFGTIGVTTGKWYWEVYCKTVPTINGLDNWSVVLGIGNPSKLTTPAVQYNIGGDTNDVGYWRGFRIQNNTTTDISSGSVAAFCDAGQIISFVLDLDAGTPSLKMYVNDVLKDTYTTNIVGPYSFGVSFYGNTPEVVFNSGQDKDFGGHKTGSSGYTDSVGIGSFYYNRGSTENALALCTANLPDPAIDPNVDDVPEDYFKAVAYAGRSTVGDYQVVTGMQPDLVWIKSRNVGHNHYVVDSINGVNSNLATNITNADPSNSPIEFTSFNTDGFTAKFATGGGRTAYSSDGPFVAWTWKAGGTPSADGVAMVDGSATTCSAIATAASASITPTRMSVNTKAGFSIVKYGGTNTTGLLSSSVSSATIPHGLSGCDFCIIKNLDNPNTWVVSHSSIAPNVMSLQSTGVANSTPPVDPTYGQITTLGSNTVTITRGTSRGDNVGENLNSWNYIAYCWYSVPGYSAFGSYTGNGSADGPFVYLGFRPAWVMVKRTDVTNNWFILDNERNLYNYIDKYLAADSSAGDGTASNIADFISNGIKIRGGSTYYGFNATGGTYIYAAFAEQPFKYSNAR